jgi:cholest-4-en-3-one 26-monooxygenase
VTTTVPSRPAPPVDLTERELYRGGFPHEIFTTLRREAPVTWQEFPAHGFEEANDAGFWVITRHDDVQAANRDTETFGSLDGPSLAGRDHMRGTILVSMDAPAHTRQRKLISAGFTPRMIGRLEERARRWAVSIIESALDKGTCNFVSELAYQLPMHMIADIIGIPLAEREWLFNLTTDFLQNGDPQRNVTPEQARGIELQMFEYAQKLGQDKRKNPKDDVWTLLSTVEVQTDDGEMTRLGELELDMFFLLLTLAGSETTRNAISGGLVALTEHPEQMDLLRRDPDAMRPAVEEILRWVSPVSYFARRATKDTEISGVPIAAGERISLWYPSANRDENVFEDPFRFDITRTTNPQVSFGGGGAHFCLGANLARREIAIMFDELLKRVKEIEILGPPTYSAMGIFNPIVQAMSELPVRLA